MLKREPALAITIAAALLVRLLDLANFQTDTMDPELIDGAAEFLVFLISGLLIRAKVFSEHTIRSAGLTPTAVQSRAESPEYHYARGE